MNTATIRRRLIDYKELTDHEKKNLAILETVRRRSPIARAEIARLTDFNIVTVTSYVDQYLKKGILKEVGIDISSGGRKPALVGLNENAVYVIGVGLNAVEMNAVLCNIKGKVLSRVHIPRPMTSGDKVIDVMMDLVDQLIKESQKDVSQVYGIGIGFPGILSRESNTVRWPMGLGTKDLSLSLSLNEKFQKRFGLSVIVDNDANTAVFGEQWHSTALDIENAIYLYSGAGIGLLINKRIYRGHSGSAGEWLFDMTAEHPEEWVQEAINGGTWAIDLGITHRARDQYEKYPASKIHQMSGGDPKSITLSIIIQAASEGDRFASELLTDAGKVLGRKAAALVNLLNPEMIIVGGGLEKGGLHFIRAINDEIKKCCVPEAAEKLKVIPSHLSENAVSMGAAALVTQSFFVGG